MAGWIMSHRSKLDWEWFTDYKTAHLFEYLLLSASHNRFKFKGTTFNAGQLPFGLSVASERSGLSVQMIRTSLKKLELTGEITKKSSTQGTVITILNWDKYQGKTTEVTNDQQTINKRSTTTNNVNNEKNVNNIKAPGEESPDANVLHLKSPAVKKPKPKSKSKPKGAITTLSGDEDIELFLKTVSHEIQDSWVKIHKDPGFIKLEILKAIGWLVSNPTNRKSNLGAFMTNWLNRSNQNGQFKPANSKGSDVEQKIRALIHSKGNTPGTNLVEELGDEVYRKIYKVTTWRDLCSIPSSNKFLLDSKLKEIVNVSLDEKPNSNMERG